MVLASAPKLHSLIGIVAVAAILPVGCSNDEFEGCEASRTCPPKNDAGEAGAGADSGGTNGRGGSAGEGGADTGGSSGSSSGGIAGSAGVSGTAGSGEGGEGGSEGDTDRPTVVSFTPGDGDEDVERNVTVTAELSEPLDEATVTSESVTLTGPEGDVSGSVTLADNVISFVPDEPLSLLTSYTFTLADIVADLAGNTLAQSESVEFRARDGRWREPTYPFGTTVSRTLQGLQRNSRGDAVIGMAFSPSRDALYGSVYDAAGNQWTTAAEIARTPGVSHLVTGSGIDSSRRAILAWDSSAGTGAWSRFDGANTWSAGGQVGRSASATATPGGTALIAWKDASPIASTETTNLSNGEVAAVVPLDLTDPIIGPYPIASLERLAMIWSRLGMDNQQEILIAWKEDAAWSPPAQIAQGVEIANFLVDCDEAGNIMVVWHEIDQIRSRIYERGRNAWSRELPIATTTSFATVRDVAITSGNAIVAVNSFDETEGSWAAVYRPDVGWANDTFVRLDDPGIGYPIEVSIDSAGNALAVWQSELKFRRYVAGNGWQAPSSLDANVSDSFFGGAGASDGSVLIVATDLGRNADGLPMAVRFE